MLPQLREVLPELYTLGNFDLDNRIGPAIWLKCVIADVLEDIDLPDNLTPIIFLPGISRSELRAIELCPENIQPLAELQYRGQLWSQYNGKDWTVNAYLSSEMGSLGFDIAKDKTTQDALLMALPEVLSSDINELKGKRLEASDFNQLLSNDPIRDLLSWMNSPKAVVERWSAGRWKAFCNEAKRQFDLDIKNDGEFTAAEKLCAGEGPWANVWQRYSDSPDIYPSLITLLERVPMPADLFANPASYPLANAKAEESLMNGLKAIAGQDIAAARTQILALEKTHGSRRSSLWAKLGYAPWAKLLES